MIEKTSGHTSIIDGHIRRLTLSRDLTREFVATTDMRKLMGVIFSRVLSAIHAEAGSLWMVDWKTKENVCHLAEGGAKDKVLGLRLPQGKGIVGTVIKTRKSEVVFDCAKDLRYSAEVDENTGFVTRSMICVPLTVDQHVYGAIQIINKTSGDNFKFTQDDVELVEDLAISAAISMQNARLHQTEGKIREMEALMKISREITSTLDLHYVLGVLVNMAGELVQLSFSAVSLLDDKKNVLMLAALSGGEEVKAKDERQQNILNLMGKVRVADRLVYIKDREGHRSQRRGKLDDWLRYMDEYQVSSIWTMPMKDEEGCLGILWFESGQPGFADNGRSNLLTILNNQAAVAVRNASLYQQVPFAEALGKFAKKGQLMLLGWRKWSLITLLLIMVCLGLHYIPALRTFTGNCVVEARLGHGVFLQVEGRVAEILVKEGQMVRKGQLLARLDASPFLLHLAQAESELAVLERKVVEATAEGNVAAVRRYAIKRAAVRAEDAKAREELKHVKVTAPRNGIVLTPSLDELLGATLPVGAELLRLADPKQLTVVMEIPEQNLVDIRVKQRVVGVVRAYPGKRFRGRVTHVGHDYELPGVAVDPEASGGEIGSGGFVAEIKVESSDLDLRPGMSGKVKIQTPDSSLMVRIFRRIKNTVVFWLSP